MFKDHALLFFTQGSRNLFSWHRLKPRSHDKGQGHFTLFSRSRDQGQGHRYGLTKERDHCFNQTYLAPLNSCRTFYWNSPLFSKLPPSPFLPVNPHIPVNNQRKRSIRLIQPCQQAPKSNIDQKNAYDCFLSYDMCSSFTQI